jgi:hydroxymethylbilane synthase
VSERTFVVGSRASALALTQTELVIAALRVHDPEIGVRVERVTTTGDTRHDLPLSALGGRGVFVDAIEEALRQGTIDFAVHSAKDLPSRVPEDMQIVAFLERADPRDVVVSRVGTVAELPPGARVGTSSQRRVCQLRAVRPDLALLDIRGNVDTRLRKLDAGEFDALVLAGAGLVRLGLSERVTEWLPTDRMIPSPGQGALAIEIRASEQDLVPRLSLLDHGPTSTALAAERAFLARLGAGCSAAVGAYATVRPNGDVILDAFIGAADGRMIRSRADGPAARAGNLGEELANELLANGASQFLTPMPE